MKMTKTVALTTALTFIPEEQTEVRDTLVKMIEQLSKPRNVSDEAKARANEKRKTATAQARAELVAEVAPILRNHLTADVTDKELFEVAKDELPEGFSKGKVQYAITRMWVDEVVKHEGKTNGYTRKV